MPPGTDPKSAADKAGNAPPGRAQPLDYAAPRSGALRVKVPHGLYRFHKWMVSPTADVITLVYCLVAGTSAYVFRCVGVVFVDAAAESRRMKSPDEPAAEA